MATTDIGSMVIRLVGDISSYESALRTAVTHTQNAVNQISQAGSNLTNFFTKPLMGLGLTSVKTFRDFDEALYNSASLVGATRQQLDLMRQSSIKMSTEMPVAAEKVAGAFWFLFSAGLNVEKSIAAMPVIARFATANLIGMEKATSLLVGSQTALGMASDNARQNLEGLQRTADLLTKANILAQASAEEFGKSLTRQAGPSLRAVNKTMEEGLAILAVMARANIKAQLASGFLDRGLRLLANAASKHPAIWKRVGIAVFDSSGNYRHMADIMEDMEKVMLHLAPESRTIIMNMLRLDTRTQQAMLPMLGFSKLIRQFHNELMNAGGTIDDVAAYQMQSFNAQTKIMQAHIRAAGIEIGEVLAPFLKELNKVLSQAAQWWNSLSRETRTTIIIILGLVAAFGPLVTIIGLLPQLIRLMAASWLQGLGVMMGPFRALSATLLGVFDVIAMAVTGPLNMLWRGMTFLVGGAIHATMGLVQGLAYVFGGLTVAIGFCVRAIGNLAFNLAFGNTLARLHYVYIMALGTATAIWRIAINNVWPALVLLRNQLLLVRLGSISWFDISVLLNLQMGRMGGLIRALLNPIGTLGSLYMWLGRQALNVGGIFGWLRVQMVFLGTGLLNLLNPIRILGFALRGLRVILATVFGPWGLLIMAATVALSFFLVKMDEAGSAGGAMTKIWQGIKDAFNDFIDWIRPAAYQIVNIVQAAWENLVHIARDIIWNNIQPIFASFRDWITGLWGGSGTDFELTWENVRLAVLSALIAIEFALRNSWDIWDYTYKFAQTGLVSLGNQFTYWFTEAFPAIFEFMATNWRAILTDMWNASKAIFNNLIDNMATAWNRIRSGRFDMSGLFEDLGRDVLRGFERTVPEFELPVRVAGEWEAELGRELAELGAEISGSFADFRDARLAELLREPDGWFWNALEDSMGQEDDLPPKIDQTFDKLATSVKSGMGKFDVALTGSAESISRLQEYAARIEEGFTGKGRLGGPGGTGGKGGQQVSVAVSGGAEAGGRVDRQTEYLREIRDALVAGDRVRVETPGIT